MIAAWDSLRYNEIMPSELQSTTRLPRFHGIKHPRVLELTARDVAIVAAVARFRFLTSTQIVCLIGGSSQQILRRLQLLFHHGYLDRPRSQIAQLAHAFDEGNRPFTYGLARAGARLLHDAGVDINAQLDWTTKNTRATAYFLAHTIEVADAIIAFELAVRAQDAIVLLDHHAILPFLPVATQQARDPFRCRVSVRVRGQREPLTIGVVPDRLFSLVYSDATRHNFALELDRGTMDLRSRVLVGKSSFRRKLMGYFAAWNAGRFRDLWNFRSLRVLTLAPSEKRIEHMLDVQHEVTGGTAGGLFLYSTRARLAQHGVFGPSWLSAKGPVSLLADPLTILTCAEDTEDDEFLAVAKVDAVDNDERQS